MKLLFAIALMFATILPANAQAEKSEIEIAIQNAMTVLRQIPGDLVVLDESNKKLAKSNQEQIDTTKVLDKQQHKIQYEEWPELSKKIDELNEKIARTRASGCPEERTAVAVELAIRCNALNAESRGERARLEAIQNNMNSQIQTINQKRQTVSSTTLANAAQQKRNNAALDDLQSKKLSLYAQVITRSMNLAKSKAIASQSCKSLTLEKAHCCLSVVSDGTNPAQCDVELLFKLFENAGAFSTTVLNGSDAGRTGLKELRNSNQPDQRASSKATPSTPSGQPMVVDARNVPSGLSKGVDKAIASVYSSAPSGVDDRVRKGFQAVMQRDWKVAKVWFEDALNRDPNNASLKRLVALSDSPQQSIKSKETNEPPSKTKQSSAAPTESSLQQPDPNDIRFLFPGLQAMKDREQPAFKTLADGRRVQMPQDSDMEFLFGTR